MLKTLSLTAVSCISHWSGVSVFLCLPTVMFSVSKAMQGNFLTSSRLLNGIVLKVMGVCRGLLNADYQPDETLLGWFLCEYYTAYYSRKVITVI